MKTSRCISACLLLSLLGFFFSSSLTAHAQAVIPAKTLIQAKQLRLPMVPFVYNSVARVKDANSLDEASATLLEYEYLVCTNPGKMNADELYVANGIKGKVKIFGYIDMGGTPLTTIEYLEKEIDGICEQGWYGVFIDQFGYDFGETRARQNLIVDYAHAKGLVCFVNSWFIDDAFGKHKNPDNPQGVATHLTKDDWYLIESFFSNNSGYYSNINDMLVKCRQAQLYKHDLGIKVVCLTYKRDAVSWAEAEADSRMSYLLTLFYGFNGWWFTDRCENDELLHGIPPVIDLGRVVTKKFVKPKKGYLVAETDNYHLWFDLSTFPMIRSGYMKTR